MRRVLSTRFDELASHFASASRSHDGEMAKSTIGRRAAVQDLALVHRHDAGNGAQHPERCDSFAQQHRRRNSASTGPFGGSTVSRGVCPAIRSCRARAARPGSGRAGRRPRAPRRRTDAGRSWRLAGNGPDMAKPLPGSGPGAKVQEPVEDRDRLPLPKHHVDAATLCSVLLSPVDRFRLRVCRSAPTRAPETTAVRSHRSSMLRRSECGAGGIRRAATRQTPAGSAPHRAIRRRSRRRFQIAFGAPRPEQGGDVLLRRSTPPTQRFSGTHASRKFVFISGLR